jgi:SpoVK/Ycf46/Vps4 family AAA+-type ATPase
MSVDPVVMALRAALNAQDGAELRVALGNRLFDLGDAAAALREHEAALALEPANLQALESAAKAAERTGDAAKASAYRMALGALSGSAGKPSASATSNAAPPARPALASVQGTGATTVERGASADPRPALRLVTDDEPAAEAEPRVTFADIGGLDDVKQRLNRSFLLPLQNPELFAKFGKSLRGGLLLYGPPGCGKTFVARALAGELGARFFSIAISDVLDMYIGESERKLHEIFENARRHAPAVMFFDELDALGQKRVNLARSAGKNFVNQLLSELDGVESRNKDLYVLGATNHPWDIDTALRRPGRFDRLVFVPAPDLAARARIVALKLEGRPVSDDIDAAALAQKLEGFSGADIQALVDGATERAFERTVDTGVEQPISQALLLAAHRDMKPSTRPWLETARNYAVYANEGGSYDDLLAYLKARGMA